MNRLIRVKRSNRAQPVRLMKQLLAVLSASFVAVMFVAVMLVASFVAVMLVASFVAVMLVASFAAVMLVASFERFVALKRQHRHYSH